MPYLSQSVVIPAFNEEQRIERSVTEVLHYLDNQPYQSEVIVVDDGSTDRTIDILRRIRSSRTSLRIIEIEHAGKAAAVRSGMSESVGDLVLFADADMATPICCLERFRNLAMDGFDVVIGSREGVGAQRIGEPSKRHIMGRVFNGMVRLLLLPGLQDTQCGFKLFTRQAVRDVLAITYLYTDSDSPGTRARVTAFDVELLVAARRLGYDIEVVPVTWTFGERSKVHPITDTAINVRDVLQVKWNDIRGRYS